jgi:hypothetical protein
VFVRLSRYISVRGGLSHGIVSEGRRPLASCVHHTPTCTHTHTYIYIPTQARAPPLSFF